MANLSVRSRSATFALAAGAAFIVIMIVLFPDLAFQSSLRGLRIWWDLVFPALFPFLVLTEFLLAYGILHGAGVLADPLARFLFGVRGGGWAIAIGWLAGYPAGARIAAHLRRTGRLDRAEAERLLAVSGAVSPLVIVSVVAAAFFRDPGLALLLVAAHFASAVGIGLLQRIVAPAPVRREPADDGAAGTAAAVLASVGNADAELPWAVPPAVQGPPGRRALDAARLARHADGRSFGKLLGDSVLAAIQQLLLIGGFMMVFSVILNVLSLSGVYAVLPTLLSSATASLGIDQDTWSALLTGALELHLGSYAASEAVGEPRLLAAAAGAILGWGGLCVHLQVVSACRRADLRYVPFALFRLAQAALAGALTFLGWAPLHAASVRSAAAFGFLTQAETSASDVSAISLWPHLPAVLFLLSLLLLIMALSGGLRRRSG